MNELYWLAEDLVAYTDLTGNHFDIEKAQIKLWKMRLILAKNDFPKIQNLYGELEDSLVFPAFFDKPDFAEKVNELYQLLEKTKIE